MKNVFIAGVARSGKSTISRRLHDEFNYNHIPLDYFASSFKHNFRETKITSDVLMSGSEPLAIFIDRVMSIIDCTEELFVIDSAHIKPEDLIKHINRDNWEIVYVGYPNIAPIEKLNSIRKYDDKDDWTGKKSDEELLEILSKLVTLSKSIEDDCKKHDIKFINTSKNFKETLNKEYLILRSKI